MGKLWRKCVASVKIQLILLIFWRKKLPKILYHKIETKNPGTSLIMASFFLSRKRRMIDSFSHGNTLMVECLWNTDKVIPKNIYVQEVGHCVNYMDDTWMIYSGHLEEHWIVKV